MTQRQQIDAADLVAFARGLQGWYGAAAVSYARHRARELRLNGDDSGHDVWLQLAAIIKDAEGKHASGDEAR
jgi:hypothetical protein